MFVELVSVFHYFCFKQKTAYEMRISDWSSDLCSSDLRAPPSSRVLRQSNPGERPALVRVEEVPVAAPDVPVRRDAAPTPEHHLVRHELAVVDRKSVV